MSFWSDFKESNRWKHFVLAVPLAFAFTILCVLGCAGGMEFKDQAYGGKWDWKDFGFTLLGGLVGQLLQILVIYLILI